MWQKIKTFQDWLQETIDAYYTAARKYKGLSMDASTRITLNSIEHIQRYFNQLLNEKTMGRRTEEAKQFKKDLEFVTEKLLNIAKAHNPVINDIKAMSEFEENNESQDLRALYQKAVTDIVQNNPEYADVMKTLYPEYF